MQLGHKRRSADPRHTQTAHHQAQLSGKLGLLYKAKCIGRIGNPLNGLKPAFQGRFAHRCLHRVVIYQQNGCHGPQNWPPSRAF